MTYQIDHNFKITYYMFRSIEKQTSIYDLEWGEMYAMELQAQEGMEE